MVEMTQALKLIDVCYEQGATPCCLDILSHYLATAYSDETSDSAHLSIINDIKKVHRQFKKYNKALLVICQ
ncbi:hypothetical protein Tco_1416561, partial [Tanacetum coccineum]